jgi:mevalonate kinase
MAFSTNESFSSPPLKKGAGVFTGGIFLTHEEKSPRSRTSDPLFQRGRKRKTREKKAFRSSAPATVMLFGEHAVLHNKLALVAAVNQRLHVTLTLRDDHMIHVQSSLGSYITSLDDFHIQPPFQFVLACIQHFLPSIRQGFNLAITSSFSSTVGLGSSAAVVAATTDCLMQWLTQHNKEELFAISRTIIQQVQGCGSGADAAASIYGGVIAYRMHPILIEKIETAQEFTLIYSGYKTPTPEVIKKVQQENSPEKLINLYEEINTCVEQAKQALQKNNTNELKKVMAQHYRYQKELGVSDETLDALIKEHSEQGAKISGSGLGDCIVVLGNIQHSKQGAIIPIQLSPSGIENAD